jgi:hypothetical protein
MDKQAGIVVKGWIIDQSLLDRQAIRRCQHDVCKAACCADGVWLDVAQAQAICDNADRIKPFLPPERRDPETWFVELHNDHLSFPSGQYTGSTTVPDPARTRAAPNATTCVFLRPEDRYCAIQAASMAEGRSPWELKPFYCCLFPLIDEYESETVKTLKLDHDNELFDRGGGCRENCPVAEPIFQTYAEETSLILGVDGYRELCALTGVSPRL